MPYAYLYAPVSGSVTNLDHRQCCCTCCPSNTCPGTCNCSETCNNNNCLTPCTHIACNGGGGMVDIGTGDSEIYLQVNATVVRSIRTYVQALCCNRDTSSYSRAVTVELWSQQYANGVHIGTILYGHIDNPQVGHNNIINLASGSLRLGYTLGGPYGSCFSGRHIHMEKWAGSRVVQCGAGTTRGSTLIYQFYFTEPG